MSIIHHIGIYYIKNKFSGQIYIGQSVDIEKRWGAHTNLLDKGTHTCYKLQNDWTLYGGETAFEFGILRECTKEELDVLEQSFIDKIPTVLQYNVMGKVGAVPSRIKRKWARSKKAK